MKLWLRRRDSEPDDRRLREATEQVTELEKRAEAVRVRFDQDHLTRLFREGRRRNA